MVGNARPSSWRLAAALVAAALLGMTGTFSRAQPAPRRRPVVARPDGSAQDASRADVAVTALDAGAAALADAPSASPRAAHEREREDGDRAAAEGLYERLCSGCHGPLGEGDGPLARYLAVAPRDFTRQPFKWRSTPSGSRPTVDDVARTIARGVPGGAMPAFGAALRPRDRALLARYVLALGARGRAPGAPVAPLALGAASPEVLARGAEVYTRLQCGTCHGDALRGDGPSAALQSPRPYDLTRAPPRGGADPASILRALRTGLDGTSMPAFDGAAPDDDLAALAHWVASRVPPDVAARRAANDPGEAAWLRDDGALAARELATPPPSGLLADPSRAALERAYWDLPLAPQGPGPGHLAPAEFSLHPDRCARCHARQFEQFRTTVHAAAMGPGVMGQLIDMPPRDALACQTCHGPLAEQSPVLAARGRHGAQAASGAMTVPAPAHAADAGGVARAAEGAGGADALRANPAFDAELREQGVVCAACHLRGRERFGPPSRAAVGASATHALRLPGSLYPLTRLARFERGDFCAPCHQHTAADSVAGRPILDTVAEWIEGPYFARGVQCQHCHMPDRDHTWRGAHDHDAVRQAVRLYARVARDGGEARAEVGVENVGAGHAFPGTATPSAVLTLQWVDGAGRAVGAPVIDTIQRRLEWDGRRFVQRFDTRIAPGAARVVRAATRDAAARALRFTLTFRPDDYYEGFYAREARQPWRSARGRALLDEALRRARASPFVVREGVVALP